MAVKLIYGTGIGNNAMDGVGLMEGLINSIKVRIPAKKTKYQPSTDTFSFSVCPLKGVRPVCENYGYRNLISPLFYST